MKEIMPKGKNTVKECILGQVLLFIDYYKKMDLNMKVNGKTTN